MTKMVVNSADYGMTDGITDGCLHAIRDGILNTVGLMTNNKCSVRAAEEIKKFPHVSVGQEINLVSGRPVTDPALIPSLVNEDGRFLTSKERMNLYSISNLRELDSNPDIDPNLGLSYDEVLLETENQVKRFIELMGRKPLYMIGHSLGTHYINDAREEIARKYGINTDWKSKVYNDKQRWYKEYSKTKSGFTPDIQANTDVLGYILEDRGHLLEHDYAILGTHCGFFDKELMDMSSFNVIRGIECSMLCDPAVKQWIKDNNVELMNAEQLFTEVGIQ